jgi:hypothetical protein
MNTAGHSAWWPTAACTPLSCLSAEFLERGTPPVLVACGQGVAFPEIWPNEGTMMHPPRWATCRRCRHAAAA